MDRRNLLKYALFSIVIFLSIGAVFAARALYQKNLSLKAKAETPDSRIEFHSSETFSSDTSGKWLEFNNEAFKYSFFYPPEFKLEKRGSVSNVEDLVALDYFDGSKNLTVVKIQITSELQKEQGQAIQQGKDSDGNEVFIFKRPYGSDKTLTLIGTVYPAIGSTYKFEEVINQIAGTLKINL